MNKYTFFLFFLITCNYVVGQQDAQFTQFMFNKLTYNPGYAGSAGHPSFTAIHRSQWVGLEGAPASQGFSFHMPFSAKRIGAGLSINHDKIGPTRSIFLGMSYAYRIKMKTGVLSIGLQGAIRHFRVDWDQIVATHVGDELIANSENSKILPNVGLGVYYETERFYVGGSIPHLVKGDISLLSSNISSTDIPAVEDVHAYLMTGFLFDLGDEVKFKPALLVKYVKDTPLDIDFNGSFLLANRFWLGLSYRLGGSTYQGFGESIDLVVQYHVNNALKIGAAYDVTLSEIKEYNRGSYELLVQYNILSDKGSRFTNPRFF